MPSVTVGDRNSPTKDGPEYLTAKTALDAINTANAGWNVTMSHQKTQTVYTSVTAGIIHLLNEVEVHFPPNSDYRVY